MCSCDRVHMTWSEFALSHQTLEALRTREQSWVQILHDTSSMICPGCCKVRKTAMCWHGVTEYRARVVKHTANAQYKQVKQVALGELFCEQILYLAKFMVCSQQISDPIRPTELSQASSPDPSPRPHTYRSAYVGRSLRCTPRKVPSLS